MGKTMNFAEGFDQVKKWCLGVHTVGEAEEGIRRDTALQQGLKSWTKRLGKTALILAGLTIVTRAGFMLIPTAIAAGAYGAVRLASYLVDRDIRNKQVAEQQIAAEGAQNAPAPKPARQPSPKLTAKATGAFNTSVTAEPANDTAPASAPAVKPFAFLKRFGIGG